MAGKSNQSWLWAWLSQESSRSLRLSLKGSIHHCIHFLIFLTESMAQLIGPSGKHIVFSRLHRQLRGAQRYSLAWYQTSCCFPACTTCLAAQLGEWLVLRFGFTMCRTLPLALKRSCKSLDPVNIGRAKYFNNIKIRDLCIRMYLFENILKCLANISQWMVKLGPSPQSILA